MGWGAAMEEKKGEEKGVITRESSTARDPINRAD